MPQTTLPPGEYWVGDPCYVIDDSQWAAFRKSIDRQSGHSQHPGHQSAVFTTRYGDGNYPDDRRRHYSVDSGQIGAVPRELAAKCTKGADRKHYTDLGNFITSKQPLDCSADEEGHLRFGEITIYTGDLPEDEDEDDEGYWD